MLLVLLPIAGCVTSHRSANAETAPSHARLLLRERLAPMIEKLLKQDGWTGTIAERKLESRIQDDAGGAWSRDEYTFDIAACDPADGSMVAIPIGDGEPILRTLRRRIRDLIEDDGGEQLDWTIGESYHERKLVFQYRQADTLGWITVRFAPRTDGTDDFRIRIEVSVHEQPAS